MSKVSVARKGWRSHLRVFLAFAVVLIALRAVLPFGLLAYLDRVFDGSGYELEIEDLDLNLWRGAYELEGVKLLQEGVPEQASGSDQELAEGSAELPPLFEAERVDLSIDWSGLGRGVLVAQIVLDRPIMSFVLGNAREQTGEVPSWQERLSGLFPFRFDRIVARDGEMRFELVSDSGGFDLLVNDLYLEALNLTNIRDTSQELPARVKLAGRPLETGELEVLLQLDALSEPVRFELDAELRRLPLVALNDFLQHYGGVDAEGGEASFYVELASSEGALEGYLKTLLEGVDVASFGEVDDPVEALKTLWEALVQVAAEVLENQPHDRLATRIPLQGRIDAVDTDPLEIVLGVIGNAFFEALSPVLDETIEIEDVVQGKGDAS